MDPVSLLLSPQGRIPRLPYFVSVVVVSVAATLVAGGVLVFSLGAAFTGLVGLGLLGFLALALVALASLYCSAVLMVKRLHDLGRSGWHAAWILLAGLFAGGGGENGDVSVIGAVFSFICIAASLWLFLAPGDRHANDYGLPFSTH